MELQRRYNIDDWLVLHGLDREEILTILNDIPKAKPIESESFMFAKIELTLQDAVNLIFRSFENELGIQQASELLSKVNLRPQTTDEIFPYAFHNVADQFPSIVCNYHADARTLMCLAHEYGHVVQLILSKRDFIPPVHRELAAFLGEKALISHAKKNTRGLGVSLQRIFQMDSKRFLGPELAILRKALETNDSEYNYRWNYPMARLISENLCIDLGKAFAEICSKFLDCKLTDFVSFR